MRNILEGDIHIDLSLRLQTLPALSSVDVANNSVDASDNITILGVAVDRHLSMDAHVSSIMQSRLLSHACPDTHQVIPP